MDSTVQKGITTQQGLKLIFNGILCCNRKRPKRKSNTKGLKHPDEVGSVTFIWNVQKGNPTQQGLKHIEVNQKLHVIQVQKGNPTQQGLKQHIPS